MLTVRKNNTRKAPLSALVLFGLEKLAYVIDPPIWQPSLGGLSNYLNNRASRK